MHPSNDLDRPGAPTPVELQVLDPWLRHRIAAALQRAGVGAVEGAIEVTIRPGHRAGGSHLIELDADGQSDEPLLAADPGRARAAVETLAELPLVRRLAARLEEGPGLRGISGDSSLFAAALARRATPAGRMLALEHGRRLTVERLETALAEADAVFVGDVDEAPAAVQAALARRVTDGSAARRAIVSLTAAPADAAAAGRLTRELAQALEGHLLVVEPIRRRREDLDAVVAALLSLACAQLDRPRVPELTADAAAALHAHHWPGGVDEVAAALERAALLSDGERITRDDLPPSVAAGVGQHSPFLPDDWAERNLRDVRESAASAAEHAYLDAVLRHTRGVIKDAAAMCGIGPRSLYDRMQQHGLRKEDYKH